MKRKSLISSDYLTFVADLKSRISMARISAARAVSRDLILLYWDIGRGIVEKQETFGWGGAVVEQLSRDLRKAFPVVRGFSARNLWDMRRFFEAYRSPAFLRQAVAELTFEKSRQLVVGKMISARRATDLEFLRQAVAEIPWGQHLTILNKVESPGARLYYLRATARFHWTRNVLLNQIKARSYQRSLREKKTHNFELALPERMAEQADEILKSSYNLEFLGIHRAVQERELEEKLIGSLKDFILELGYGFCFVGRQFRLTLGRKEYFLDLLFYQRFLKALVAVELKVGPFEPEHAGKMDFYLNLLNEKERAPDDRPSIGIVLCAEKDNLEVEFALKTKMNPIGVAEYQLRSSLPAAFKGKLPSSRQLTDAVRAALPRKIKKS